MVILKNKILLISIVFVFMLSFFSGIYSQEKSGPQESFFGLTPQKSSFSLLDPSRLNMTHSYTLWYSSGKKGSESFGLYVNTLQYQFSNPLKMTVELGYMHQTPFWQRTGSSLETQRFLSNFLLEYKKSNFYFLLKVGNLPRSNNWYYNPWDRRW